MRFIWLFLFYFGVSFLWAQETLLSLGPGKAFSAEITTAHAATILPDGIPSNSEEKVYRDDKKLRIETEDDDGKSIMIYRYDLGVSYEIKESEKIVIETPLVSRREEALHTAGMALPPGEMELVGPDTVDGEACTKYRTKLDLNSNARPFFYWEDAKTKAPVKSASQEGDFTVTWKNYVAGPPDASLFEEPAGYQIQKMKMSPPPARH